MLDIPYYVNQMIKSQLHPFQLLKLQNVEKFKKLKIRTEN